MKKGKFSAITTIFAVALSTLVALGFLSMPTPKTVNESGFSAERAAEHIKVIEKKPHSLFRDAEREEVRDYLTLELSKFGGSVTVISHKYFDPKIHPDTLNLHNILLTIGPLHKKASSMVMLAAHYDSAESLSIKSLKGKPSYGAADDGYGISVSLEILNNVIKNRDKWEQGIKVLFTDGEECGTLGMKKLWDINRILFDNVGLFINIEARGMKGPALLFETSTPNSNIIDLYSQSPYNSAYSLSSTVYNTLPNYTDFTVVKDSLSGVNFSVIDNLYYYHTPNDNIYNISLKSIQHYGEQITPMVKSFLTDKKYASTDYFKNGSELIYFSIPLIGLVKMSQLIYIILNIILLLIIATIFIVKLRDISIISTIKKIGILMLGALAVIATGELIAYLLGLYSNTPFKLIGMIISSCDSAIMAIYYLLITVLLVRLFNKNIANIAEIHFCALILNSLLILATLILFPDNFYIFVPTLISTICFLIRWRFGSSSFITKISALVATILITLTIIPILYILSVGLAIGAMGVTSFILYLSLIVTIPISIEAPKNA